MVQPISFSEFMDRVDKELKKCGISSHLELADYAYADAWEDGCSPEDTAIEALENDDVAGLFLGEGCA